MMNFKVGLEKEFFVTDLEGSVVLCPDKIPADACGWLAEARGNPHDDIVEAVHSLHADCHRIEKKIASLKVYKITDEPVMTVDKSVRFAARKKNGKGRIMYGNLYGYESHRNSQSEATAGVHISLTNPCFASFEQKSVPYNGNFDWPSIFMAIDNAFKDEIKAAKRNPGFYEMKFDGRVEYRSLPSNVDLDKVIEVLSTILLGEPCPL